MCKCCMLLDDFALRSGRISSILLSCCSMERDDDDGEYHHHMYDKQSAITDLEILSQMFGQTHKHMSKRSFGTKTKLCFGRGGVSEKCFVSVSFVSGMGGNSMTTETKMTSKWQKR